MNYYGLRMIVLVSMIVYCFVSTIFRMGRHSHLFHTFWYTQKRHMCTLMPCLDFMNHMLVEIIGIEIVAMHLLGRYIFFVIAS